MTADGDPVFSISKLPFKIAFRWWRDEDGEHAEARAEDGTMVRVDPALAKAAVGDPDRFQHLPAAEMMAIAAAVARQGRQ